MDPNDDIAKRKAMLMTVGGSTLQLRKPEVPITTKINNLPALLFDDHPKEFPMEETGNALHEFCNSKSYTPVDGLARGLTAFGTSLVSGVVGVFAEPVVGASKNGAAGFFTGIGKGLAGLVLKPVAGTVALAQKTAEGVVNTPDTIIDVGQRLGHVEKPTRHFGIPLAESIAKAKAARVQHVLLRMISFLRTVGKTTDGIFTKPFNEFQVNDWKDAVDDGYDIEFEGYDPHDVAALFKLYFESLPEALIPRACYYNIISIAGAPNANSAEGWRKMSMILKMEMPPAHATVLNEVCMLVREIAALSKYNGMTIPRLGSALVLPLTQPEESATAIECGAARMAITIIFANFKPNYLTYRLVFDENE